MTLVLGINGVSIHVVSTPNPKDVWINLRISPQIRAEFKIAAAQRGASMSGLLHQYIVKVIREEKNINASIFEEQEATGLQMMDEPAIIKDEKKRSRLA